MALITCTECGKEFSDKAPSCPNCGCPTIEILEPSNDESEISPEISVDFDYKKYHITIDNNNMKLYKKDFLIVDDVLSNYILLWNKTSSILGGGQTEIVFFHPNMKNSLQIVASYTNENYDKILEFSAICGLYLTENIQKSAFTAYSYNASKMNTQTSASGSLNPNGAGHVQVYNTQTSNRVRSRKNALSCPNCKGHNIDLWSDSANMNEFQRTGLNLNPLHPLTPFKTKTVKKEKKSAAKIGLGIMTGGTSLLVTGTTKKKHNEYYCRDCGNRWIGK